ncbi:TIGR03086 family metal-binding protein [Candidatus Poriferisodalis sp.]|uniref:TIGR03086 family metal-binding protein n=1 Tax=Candidatus Poriferisodalis sp. TaxID=3101277 RepID=UPI003B025D00
MSETVTNFTRAVELFDAVVAAVPDDAWDNDTPCADWNAEQLLRHQCGVLDALAEVARSGVVNRPQMAAETDDPAGRWVTTRDGVLAALAGADLGREDDYWFGSMSFEEFLAMVQWDPLTHAWDLAQACGTSLDLPDDLCEVSLARVKSLGETARRWRLIGDEVPIADDAPIAHRYLAYVGRQP